LCSGPRHITVTHQCAHDGRRLVSSGKTLRATICETQVSPACSAADWTWQACWGPGDDGDLAPVVEDRGGGADPTVGELRVGGRVDVDIPVKDLGLVAAIAVAVGEVTGAAPERVRRVAEDEVGGLVEATE
jgi:hypothetical protein